MVDEEGPQFSRGIGVAMRIGVELVVATMLGAGLGWWGDRSFGTAPWLMLVGIVVGVAAGLRNIHRVIEELQDKD